MMIYHYSKLPHATIDTLRPYIDITIHYKTRTNTIKALIDSGADSCIITSGYAKSLMIYDDYKIGEKTKVAGIDGIGDDAYSINFEIEIKDLLTSKKIIEMKILKSKQEFILPGHNGFFNLFTEIKFRKNINEFEIVL